MYKLSMVLPKATDQFRVKRSAVQRRGDASVERAGRDWRMNEWTLNIQVVAHVALGAIGLLVGRGIRGCVFLRSSLLHRSACTPLKHPTKRRLTLLLHHQPS